ncbi:MAG: fused MFS/spermidine synthase [Actinomycetota bacterium]
MRTTRATLFVFGTSAAVLVLEIIAGRLMAPYVGISLETFTGIIGTVLAGIAVGSALGGRIADRRDPRTMIGPALVIGGALAWLSLPIVTTFGPEVGSGPAAIVILTSVAFFFPVAVLSAVSPMIAKLRLASLDETGSVVGGLSAAGTVGALAGTFLTGFVFVAAVPSKTIVVIVGAVLVAAGIVATVWLRRRPPVAVTLILALVVVWTGVNVATVSQPCEHETAYFCVRVERVSGDPSARNLYLDRLRHAYVNLEDPTKLDVRYVRLFADVAEGMPDGALNVLHIGGGGFSFPRYLSAVRPGTTNRVLEIDGDLVQIAKDELGLVESEDLQVDVGDARLALEDQPENSYDLIVGDAFAGESVPWHLTTAEVTREISRLLTPGGIYVMNVIDGGPNGFARAELATLTERFDHVAAILPPGAIPELYPVNQVLIASDAPFPRLTIPPADGRIIEGREVVRYIDGARTLTDDFAPVDQLVLSV